MIEGATRFVETFTRHPVESIAIAEGLKGAGEFVVGSLVSTTLGNFMRSERSRINQIGQKLTEKIRSHFPIKLNSQIRKN